MSYCFISYARRPLDERVVGYIVSLLDRAGLQYWWDGFAESRGGVDLNSEIARAIEAASVVLVLASSQSMSSPYCQAEIVWALQRDKRLIRIDVERFSIPPSMLPLASAHTVLWDENAIDSFETQLVAALAAQGTDAALALRPRDATDLIDDPDVNLIRPSYLQLRASGADNWREYVRRLSLAASLNPNNPYNQLSLALLWVHSRDASRALEAARAALNQLSREPEAHYVEALALCIQNRADLRSRADAETILRRLAVARALPGAGAHVDLLSALVISNYYLPKYMTPPIAPDALLMRGVSAGCRFDPSENARVFDVEPILDSAFAPSQRALVPYQ